MIARRLRQILSDRNGQALVEFAFAGPVLVLALIGVFEGGRMLWTSHTLQYAVDETGRYAMVQRTGNVTTLTTYLSGKLGSLDDVEIQITQSAAGGVTYVNISASKPFSFGAGLFGALDSTVAGTTSVPLLPSS